MGLKEMVMPKQAEVEKAIIAAQEMLHCPQQPSKMPSLFSAYQEQSSLPSPGHLTLVLGSSNNKDTAHAQGEDIPGYNTRALGMTFPAKHCGLLCRRFLGGFQVAITGEQRCPRHVAMSAISVIWLPSLMQWCIMSHIDTFPWIIRSFITPDISIL